MNVCLISEEYPPETLWGGIGTYTHNLATGLAAQGHRVHVIARTWETEEARESLGVIVHRVAVPEPSWRWGTWYWNSHLPESRALLFWNLAVKRTVDAILSDEQVNVIEAPEFHAQGLFSAMTRRRVAWVTKLHTPAYLCRLLNGTTPATSRVDRLISEQSERCMACAADTITSPSRRLADDVSRHWGFERDRVYVIPNPIDEEMFRPCPQSSTDSRPVLFVGRLERRKGVETLADAFVAVRQQLPQATLRLVGGDHPSGPDGESMKEHLTNRFKCAGMTADAISFAGSLAREQLPDVYRAAGVCVVPSLYENFPYTCLEAMACGCAVVASRVGGIPEIITDGVDGLLVAPEDAAALSQAIYRILSDADLCRDLGRRARQTVCARFSRATISSRTADLYRSLINKGRT